jgi:hypothetical protein
VPPISISGESAICYGDYVTTARVDCYCLLCGMSQLRDRSATGSRLSVHFSSCVVPVRLQPHSRLTGRMGGIGAVSGTSRYQLMIQQDGRIRLLIEMFPYTTVLLADNEDFRLNQW